MVLEQVPIDRAGVVPVKPREGLGGADRSHLGASREVARVALAMLGGAQLFDELSGRELALRRVGQQRQDGVAWGANANRAQALDEVDGVSHRSLRGRAG